MRGEIGGYPAAWRAAIAAGPSSRNGGTRGMPPDRMFAVRVRRVSLADPVDRYHGAGRGSGFLLSECGMQRIEGETTISGVRAVAEVARA